MSITVGSVTIDDNGDHTGSGLAYDMYTAHVLSRPFYDDWKGTEDGKTLKELAAIANAYAGEIGPVVDQAIEDAIDTAVAGEIQDAIEDAVAGVVNYLVLTGDVTSSSTALADTGLQFAAVSGEQYEFEVMIRFEVTALSVSPRFVIDGPSKDFVLYDVRQAASLTTYENRPCNDYNQPATISTNSPFLADNICTIRGTVKVSASGTVKIRFADELAGGDTSTVKAGSFIRWARVA